jgi:hydroxymethylbilane synthase
LRRGAQIRNLRPDLALVDIRGNVDSRLAKLDARPEWAAIVLATAGLVRLGLANRIGERLPPEIILPAPGQGALAVTVRAADTKLQEAVRRAVHDEASAVPVAAERAFLRRLEGGCQVPVAAYAEIDDAPTGATLRLHGRVVSVRGDKAVAGHEVGAAGSQAAAEELGTALAERLLAEGAAAILTEARSASVPAVSEP